MSDILNAVLVMLTAVITVTGDVREIPSIWCKLVCSFNYCLIIASMMTMFFIGVDRYFSIVYLFQHRDLITKYVIYGFISWSWIQGIAFGVVPPIIKGWVHYDYWEAICAIDWNMEGTVIYVIAAFTMCFAIPFVGLVFIYSSIIKAAFTKNSKRLEENRAHKDIKLILSLFTIVVLFFIFMAPFCVTKLLKVIKYRLDNRVSTAASILQYMASACNPFVYAIYRPDMRKGLKKLFFMNQMSLLNSRRVSQATIRARYYSPNAKEGWNSSRGELNGSATFLAV
ncbi:DgyrCDS4157 [Dimorphilus gyrociliatus]|uniref:DgyrCDS4157 n=1 Tax=Dimorphilus gyrociliatus TaxID=2664684 RepID=A0A7I8VI88_9ANNE|nr:DgyrCDS4157 [Dimorphilus gyrociliatus]